MHSQHILERFSLSSIYNPKPDLLTPCSYRLEPFHITVVDLRTGAVSTNLIKNQKAATQISLPKGSIYEPAREAVESAMRNDKMADVAMQAQQ